MMMKTLRSVSLVVMCAALAAGCAQADTSPAAAADAASATETPAAVTAVATADTASAVSAGTRACMIAGEFEILGTTIRSRDCLQAGADIPEATHQQLCEGLAQTSAQLGAGKAGELTYMDACPRPAQGSCEGIFAHKTMHAFYYERSEEDVATLPDSCRMGGGTWVP